MKFPVITISKKNVATLITSDDALTRCTKLGWKKGHFNGLIIIDSEGNRSIVDHAERISSIGPFWGYNIFGDQKIRVKFIFSETGKKVELEEFKNILVKVVSRERFFWSSGGSVTDLISAIRSSDSFMDAMQKLR